MANAKRKSSYRPFGGKNISRNENKAQQTPVQVQLVYFDPDDLQKLQQLDIELTAELRKNRPSKSKLKAFYDYLTA
ncbi:MAG: hypothetical protein JNM41_16320 [Flavipsychrobacter sp.]|nr:hypothetical protein [Flavipsychrobacter sp.]